MIDVEKQSRAPTEEKMEGAVDAMVDVLLLPADDDALPPPPILSAEEERRLWRKIDTRLIPVATLLYLVSYLDRGNIGNAKLQGLLTQLDLTGTRYNIALSMYYLFYLLFNIPSNLLLKKLRPSRWLPGLTLAWGVVATLMGLVKTYPQLVGARVCLGIAESGMSPGIYYLLSMWYPRHMLQWRFGLFWGGATFSGAFSGLVAYGISFISGAGGLLGWSWIFIIEGLVTVVASLIAFAVFVDLPATATFLTPEERSFVIHRLKADNSFVGEEEEFRFRHIVEALSDWKIIVGSVSNMAITSPSERFVHFQSLPYLAGRTDIAAVYATALFLPSIINGFGFNTAISQLLTVPSYVIATAVVIVCSTYSDRLKMRAPFVFGGILLTFIGFAINISDVRVGVKYAGTYLIVIGAYEAAPMMIAWCVLTPTPPRVAEEAHPLTTDTRSSRLGNNTVGHYKRGIGIGLQVMIGNIGGLVASNTYRVRDAPRYVPGHVGQLALTGMGLLFVPLTALVYWRGNARRDAVARRRAEESGEKREYTAEEVRAMGERAPGFRYTL
ncbi:MFS general substrate transporter [Lenzites betulinus]|nr:MFS general substrate transporter [Lenzites betulinus]